MQINFTIFATGVSIAANKLKYKAAQADTPLAPVTIIVEDPPHTFPHAITMNVPNPVPHIVQIFSTPDDSDGTLISEFLYDPTYTSVNVRPIMQVNPGGSNPQDPAIGATSVVIPDIEGWDYYVSRRAFQGVMADYEYAKTETGFSLLLAEDEFTNGDLMWIHFYPQISTSTPVFNYLNLYKDVVVIPDSITLDNSYSGKLIKIAATGQAIVITLPLLADVPNLSIFSFQTMMGNQFQTTFITSSGEPIHILNSATSTVFLGSNEFLTLIRYTDGGTINAWEVEKVSPGIFEVGRYIYSDLSTGILNASLCDGSSFSIVNYPRVSDYLDRLDPGLVFSSLAARNSAGVGGASRWVKDPITGLIHKPDCRGLILRALPGTRSDITSFRRTSSALSGSYENDGNLSHDHVRAGSRFNKFVAIAADVNPNMSTGSVDGANPSSEIMVAGLNPLLISESLVLLDGNIEATMKNDGRYRHVLI